MDIPNIISGIHEGVIINRIGLEVIFEKYNFPTCWKTKSIKILNYKDIVGGELFEKLHQLYITNHAFILKRFTVGNEKMFAIYFHQYYKHSFDNCIFWDCEIFYLE